jgi:hypothetical protein
LSSDRGFFASAADWPNPPDALRCVTLMQLPEEIVQIFPHDWAIAQ